MTSSRLDWDIQQTELESSRLDFKAETPKLKIEESSRLDGDPGDWINCSESGRNSRLQFLKNLVNWIVIQATGLINPNQEESPRGISMKIQSTGMDPGDWTVDWIRANSVLMKAYLCFKALQVQGPLDPICLDSKVRIREED